MQSVKVLLTGAHGFLGRHIVKQLETTSTVTSLGREQSNDIICDLVHGTPDIGQYYETVIHSAGKAHVVPRTPEEEKAFFLVNVEGTRNLLEALEAHPPKHFVFISSVAVYGKEVGENIEENSPLNGDTPYAKSKIDGERLVQEWGNKMGIPVLIIRPPLIAGPNPPGNLGKMINGIKSGKYLTINGGQAQRSVILAEDIGRFILENNGLAGIYNLTDNYHPSFRELEKVICTQLNKKKLPYSLPSPIAKLLGSVGDVLPFFPINSGTIEKMSNSLTFDSSKATKDTGWQPRKVLANFHI